MNIIQAKEMDCRAINEAIRKTDGVCEIIGCMGQRFIAAGAGETYRLSVRGIPGNALGAYLNGAEIRTEGNAQDAVGDTMNAGRIVVNGNIGDAAGYAMRGGMILVKGSAGYRAGIHMKAYREKLPVMVIGGRTGSFLGEYQAGGVIVVLGLHADGSGNRKDIVGNFPCTGMHGGKLFLRSRCEGIQFPRQVSTHLAGEAEKQEITPFLQAFCEEFGEDLHELLASEYTVVTPDSKNPYHQMYVPN